MSTLDTYDVPKHERYDYWAEAVSRVFTPLTINSTDKQEINGRLIWRDIGRARMTVATGSPQSVCRTSATIAAADEASIILMFQKRGVATLLHRGRSVDMSPGSIVAMDTRNPYRLSFFSNFEQNVLRIPVDILGVQADDAQFLTATALKVSFASQLLAASFSAIDKVDGHIDADLQPALLDLARLSLYAGASTLGPQTSRDRLNQAKTFIHAHLAASDLSPQKVASVMGISLRTLQNVFAPTGEPPSLYILRLRLVRVSELLVQPEYASRSITDIARSVGFQEPSYFSRAFRNKFGMSARQWRESGRRATVRN